MNNYFNELIKVDGEIIKECYLSHTTYKTKDQDFKYHLRLLKNALSYSVLVTLECFNETSLYSFDSGLTEDEAFNKYDEIKSLDY